MANPKGQTLIIQLYVYKIMRLISEFLNRLFKQLGSLVVCFGMFTNHILIFFFMTTSIIFNFEKDANIDNWVIVNDVVMGGRSTADFHLNEEGNGFFSGEVSLENNGGFASLRYRFNEIKTKGYQIVQLKIKGDGKSYQFRVKSSKYDRHSYIYKFQTNKEWQVIDIPLKKMIPSFRGYQLNIPNYDADQIEELAFLIGNKKAEKFELEIKHISLK